MQNKLHGNNDNVTADIRDTHYSPGGEAQQAGEALVQLQLDGPVHSLQ